LSLKTNLGLNLSVKYCCPTTDYDVNRDVYEGKMKQKGICCYLCNWSTYSRTDGEYSAIKLPIGLIFMLNFFHEKSWTIWAT